MKATINFNVLKRPEIRCIAVKKFQAVLPATMENKVYKPAKEPKFLRLRVNNKTYFFRVASEKVGSDHLTIHPRWTEIEAKDQTFEHSCWGAYYWYKCRNDRDEKILVAGLMITVTAIIFDALLTLGRVEFSWTILGIHFPRTVSGSTIGVLTILSFVLKVAGPSLLFWKAARDA